ncbi:Uu.00g126600.m01.CDS01 [Anthostomella pinea]|uniref:Uu.00g126600.m01.CDS01 n=1 Tax=Anthostomella pinea TaxID=933095 RepID=A0AAI8YHU0_9PEZI|nr:Uu.00g126600.m01.CDS01 [Anthostomella pinea]
MPAQTRSRGKTPATATATASKTLKSTAAAPKQQEFPHRRRSVKKTYGRSTPARVLRQGTLTQMDFTSSATQDFVDLDNDEEENEVPVLAESANPKRKARGNRRKTAGDELDGEEKQKPSKRRKTLGDAPSASASSSFHTQTLTQFLSNQEEKQDIWQVDDSEDDEDLALVMEPPNKGKDDHASEGRQGDPMSAVPTLIKSVTPSNRQKRTEIPSSQSPATPMLMRYSPAPRQSPLKSKSTNAGAPSPILKKLQKTPRNLVIADSYSTSHSSPTTPTPKSTVKATPSKRIRFDLPEDKENITPGRTKPKSPKLPVATSSKRRPLQEVPDSDEDLDDTEDDTGDEAEELGDVTIQKQELVPSDHQDKAAIEDEPEPPETYYGGLGDETQAEILSSEHLPSHEPDVDTEEDDTIMPEPPQAKLPQPVPEGEEEEGAGPSSASVIEQTPASSPFAEAPDENIPATQGSAYTQGLDSQRVPLEVIHSLGPQTPRSDIMVSLHPEHVAKIVDGTKNHEFRAWKIPPDVSRVWIYITKPESELKYMCRFGPAKTPGEIEDEGGIGNTEFNQGRRFMKYAYEILQVYQLNNPVSLQDMKTKGWVAGAPQKYTFIPPAVVGELTANLRCALFGEEAVAGFVGSSPNLTESQELKAQIQSDVEYSTQHHSSEGVNEVVSSSQTPRKPASKQGNGTGAGSGFVRPALPKAQSGSSTQGLPPLPSQRPHAFVRPSQATTASQVSSPAISPEKSAPRLITISSQSRSSELRGSSPSVLHHTHSLRSSQFPTRSQMLPDSLVNDEIQEPPPIIWDSADESD